MQLVVLLCLVTSAVAIDQDTVRALAAKTKAANEVASSAGEIFKRLGDKLKRDGQTIVDEAAMQLENVGKRLLIGSTVNSNFNVGAMVW